jgi:uncharacterized integral membrane protein (TIGR00698 family)
MVLAPTRTPGPLPGLVVVAAGTAVALVVPGLNPATAAVLLGVLLANSGLPLDALRPGLTLAGRRLIRVAVVLLGLRLSVPALTGLGAAGLGVVLVTVAATFGGTLLLGRRLGVPPARALLVATGFSICGASAVAAMEPVAGGDEEDTGVAVALVTLCGSLAILVLPLLRTPLGLDPVAFGSWTGASVHDVGQVVATAQQVPGALSAAVVVKLSRVVLLAPLVAGVGLGRRRTPGPRPPLVPLFVLGFLAAVVVASVVTVPAPVLRVQDVLLPAALLGLGSTVHLPTLARTGGRSLLLGLSSWLLVGTVAYAGVRLLGG